MPAAIIPAWREVRTPVVGMLHAPPLPGSPGFGGDVQAVIDHVLRDAEALTAGGANGLLLENLGDAPYTAGRVPAYVVAEMTRMAVELRRRFDVPLGVNVLRNDGCSALAIAAAAGGEFIRVNVLCGARVTEQGLIQGNAYALLRERALLGAGQVKILADVSVKHSAALGAARAVAGEVSDLLERGGADALVVSGAGTGKPTDAGEVQEVKEAAGRTAVFVGSGVTVENISGYGGYADGFIVGTSLKRDGVTTNAVERRRVADLVARLA